MVPSLDDVLDAFQKQVEHLAAQVAQVGNEAFRKALYVAMVDGLSACAYPNEKKAGHRFRTFVVNIANWKDGERVSLPQAALYFVGDPDMSATIAGLLTAWQWAQPQTIASDPLPNQLPAHDDLWKLAHVNLLWQFRNHILHAFSDPGGFDFKDHHEPYYTGDVPTHTWRLVMPEQFLRNLLRDGVQGLIAFCRLSGQDPQAHFGNLIHIGTQLAKPASSR
jgi:hypothetical protein